MQVDPEGHQCHDPHPGSGLDLRSPGGQRKHPGLPDPLRRLQLSAGDVMTLVSHGIILCG